MGTELVGHRLSRGTNQLGTNCGGPNVRGPNVFGTKSVTADIGLLQSYNNLRIGQDSEFAMF